MMSIGIYKIENMINHQKYIGQSIHIKKRWLEHKTTASNVHSNDNRYHNKLYSAMREYGIDNFQFSIVEECTEEKLNEREKYWIQYYDSYVNGYNMTIGGMGTRKPPRQVYCYNSFGEYICSYDSIEKAALDNNVNISSIYGGATRGDLVNNKQWSWIYVEQMPNNFSNKIPVICFSLEGKRLATYIGIEYASKQTGDSYQTIKKSCNTKTHTGQYQWRYWIEDPDIQSIPANKYNPKKAIDQYDLNGIFIKTYDSLTNAAAAINAPDITNLILCCKKQQKSYYDYMWCYHNDEPPTIYSDNKIGHTTSSNKRTVEQYSKDGKLLASYISAHEAARQIDNPKCANHITECCQGKRKTCNGFVWKYKEN